jgi:hypothetical protein
MPWVTVAQGDNLEQFKGSLVPAEVAELPKGTPLRLTIKFPTWAPIGVIGNIAGAEWWAQKLAPQGIDVVDVSGDWYNITVDAIVDPPFPAIVVIGIIALALVAVAFLIISIKLDAKQLTGAVTTAASWGTVALIGAGAFLVYKFVKG